VASPEIEIVEVGTMLYSKGFAFSSFNIFKFQKIYLMISSAKSS
jgi:hypothetical protein